MEFDKKLLKFARYMREHTPYDVRLNRQLMGPNKDVPPLVCDGKMSTLVVQDEPFFMSGKLYGIDPSNALTLDMDDLMKNKEKDPNFVYFYRTKWETQSRSFKGYTVEANSNKGLYMMTIPEIIKLVQRGAPEHVRKNKKGEKTSLVFNSNNFNKIF